MSNYSALDIAQWFVAKTYSGDSGESITQLKLQKLVYYAQAWYLANYQKPLFKEKIEAWAHGPVVREIWNKYNQHSWQPLPNEEFPSDKLNSEVFEFLEEVYEVYGDLGAKRLERLTHSENPWIEARGNLPSHDRCEEEISQKSMQKFYSRRIEI